MQPNNTISCAGARINGSDVDVISVKGYVHNRYGGNRMTTILCYLPGYGNPDKFEKM